MRTKFKILGAITALATIGGASLFMLGIWPTFAFYLMLLAGGGFVIARVGQAATA